MKEVLLRRQRFRACGGSISVLDTKLPGTEAFFDRVLNIRWYSGSPKDCAGVPVRRVINMKRPIIRVTFMMLALYTMVGFCARDAAGQQTPVQREPIAHLVYNGEMTALLAHLAERFGVTIGIEFAPHQERMQVRLELKDPTLPDVLNAIVQGAPRYRWRESEGVFEISPLRGSSPVLDTTISSFQITDASQAEAVEQLMNLPEVRAGMGAMSLQFRSADTRMRERNQARLSLRLEGVTVRQALHRIAEMSGSRLWVFRRQARGGDGEFISIGNSDR